MFKYLNMFKYKRGCMTRRLVRCAHDTTCRESEIVTRSESIVSECPLHLDIREYTCQTCIQTHARVHLFGMLCLHIHTVLMKGKARYIHTIVANK